MGGWVHEWMYGLMDNHRSDNAGETCSNDTTDLPSSLWHAQKKHRQHTRTTRPTPTSTTTPTTTPHTGHSNTAVVPALLWHTQEQRSHSNTTNTTDVTTSHVAGASTFNDQRTQELTLFRDTTLAYVLYISEPISEGGNIGQCGVWC